MKTKKVDVIKVGLLIKEPLQVIPVGEFKQPYLDQAKRALQVINDPLNTNDPGFRKAFFFLDYEEEKRRIILVGYSGSPMVENHKYFSNLVKTAEDENGSIQKPGQDPER